jgi:L-methionine (R)-S-oxide reductase
MTEAVALATTDKASRYAELMPQLVALCEGEPDLIANLANISAALKTCLPIASWVGFYIRRSATELVLGPFQGNVACVRIELGRGVCGTSAAEHRTLIVPDVEQFPGHIACDAGSRSEIVIPIDRAGQVVAVLDLDSYELAAFDDIDAQWLSKVAALTASLSW